MIYQHRERILELANSLQDYPAEKITNTPLEELYPFLNAIEEITHAEGMGHEAAAYVFRGEKMKGTLQVIRDFYRQLLVKMETEKAQEILSVSKPWPWLRSYYFYKDYESLIKNEHQMAGFTPYDRLAYIGGGALPLSLILYNQLFGMRGISIEKDPELAKISRKVLKKLDLNFHIQVIQGDETRLAEIEFEGFIVDAQAEPKKRVFNHLHATAPQEAKIVYRSYTGLQALLQSPVSPEDVSCFEKIEECLPTGRVKNTSVVVRKV